MKKISVLLALTVFAIGCARVSLQAPKEPIKLDISMRLDVYQHVEKDINSIEDIVSGADKVSKAGTDKQSFLRHFVGTAYAEDALDPVVEQAALSRKARREQVSSLLQSGSVGENKLGLLEIRNSGNPAANDVVSAENKDRMVIYQALAAKNSTTVEQIQKPYALRLQKDAPQGAPIEEFDTSSGTYQWRTK